MRSRASSYAARTDRARGAALALAVALALALALGIALVACVPTRGGWDEAALARAVPAVAAIDGQRLGDMVPFPALDLESEIASGARAQVGLVACRFAPGARIRFRAGGPGWSERAAAPALAAFAGQVEALGLAFERTDAGPAEIELEAFVGQDADAPTGLGDALVECEVGPRARGVVVRAEVRTRRSGVDAAGRVRRAGDDAWTGALLHELAHALGYSGHAAIGPSLLVRDEGRLLRFGRRVARGEPVRDPTLAALYALAPGQVLGARPLTERGTAWLAALRALDRRQRARGVDRIATIASAGDGEARVTFRYADGSRLAIRFPAWAERLRAGGPVLAWPDRETLERLRAADAPSGDASVDVSVDVSGQASGDVGSGETTGQGERISP